MKIIGIRRLKDSKAFERPPIWLVGFTDLVSLMLAFFILLFATTNIKNAAWVEASKSMRSSFGGDEQITVVTAEPGKADTDYTWASTDRDPGLDVTYLESLLKKWFSTSPVLKDLETQIDHESVLIALPSDTAFKPGGSELSDQGKVIIKTLVPFLTQLPNTVEIVGHADPKIVNEGGDFGSNWHLSLARARSVALWLETAGYSHPIDVSGRGASDMDLLPKNLPEAVRNEKARRVDIRLHILQP
jgi:chemotaxis protein MotB